MVKKRLRQQVINPLISQIERLLRKSHRPHVKVQPSLIAGGGNGVFTAHRVSRGTLLCLYPGVYSVGLPPGTEVGPFLYDEVTFMGYLFPPSGVRYDEDNSYILPIDDPPSGIVGPVSGYIDGMAVDVMVRDSADDTYNDAEFVSHRLDTNPSACGHIINHSIVNANVRVTPFLWKDILPNFSYETHIHNADVYAIPNIARKDGAPRYMHTHGSEMIFYDEGDVVFSVDDVAGAAICAMTDLDADVELYRDYNLAEEPLPDWAADWYVLPPNDSDDDDDDSDADESAEKWKLFPD